MPKLLRVMSWNLRQYAMIKMGDDELAFLVHIMRDADIVGIQEVYAGASTHFLAQPLQGSIDEVKRLRDALHANDTGADWDYSVSGACAGEHKDCYAYLYKKKPSNAKWRGIRGIMSLFTSIALVGGAIDIIDSTSKNFPNRRPCKAIFKLDGATDIQVFNFHATTPTNKDYAGGRPGAVTAVKRLADLDDIKNAPKGILIGDFNVDMGSTWVYAYDRLYVRGYTPCVVSDTGTTRKWNDTWSKYGADDELAQKATTDDIDFPIYDHFTTTVRPKLQTDPNDQDKSAYDNIFVKGITWAQGVAIDALEEVRVWKFTSKAVSVTKMKKQQAESHLFYYRNQGGVSGVSDHTPVFVDLSI